MKLSKDKLDEYKQLREKQIQIETEFEQRIEYICRFISLEMNLKFSKWGFTNSDYYSNEGVREIVLENDNDHIDKIWIEPKFKTNDQHCFYILFDQNNLLINWSYEQRFPKRWLFEDFKEEFREGRNKFLKEYELKELEKNKVKILSLKEKQKELEKSLQKLKDEEYKLESRFVKVGPHQFAKENK